MIAPEVLAGYRAKMEAEQGRPVSHEEVEQDIHRIIDRVSQMTANTRVFGYHEHDDIYQIAYINALEVLAKPDKYDPARPLENFLHTHLKRRILNLKRAEVFRAEAPCKCCDAWNPGSSPCEQWRRWDEGNHRKQSLGKAAPQLPECLSISRVEPAAPCEDLTERLIFDELDGYILERLKPEMHADYALLKADRPIEQARRTRLRAALQEILRYSPYSPADEIPPPPKPEPIRRPPAPSDRLVEHDGRVQSIKAWAREYGQRTGTVLARLRHGWSLDEAVGLVPRPAKDPHPPPQKPKRSSRLITHEGRTMTARAWSRATGIPTGMITQLLRRGWDAADVLDPRNSS
jgi:DNA-directed RNA polymerase specialized sigma24 family protein